MKTTFLPFGVVAILALGPVSAFAEVCTYRLKTDSTKLEWTAYKFSGKKGVTGHFEKTTITSVDKADTISALLDSVHFTIDSTSVQTGDPARNLNIATGFFGKMSGGVMIEGRLKADTKAKAPTLVAEVKLNGTQKLIPLVYTVTTEGLLEARGSADVLKLGLKSAFEFLQNMCRELHKGPDGKSKLWTGVDFKITALIEKSCE